MKTVLMAAACLLAVASSAFALPMLAGSGPTSTDWQAQPIFYEGPPLIGPASGPGTFDAIEIEWMSGSLFQVPAIRDLSGGWSYVGGNDQIALATGAEVSTLNLTVNFVDPTIPTVYDFEAYYHGACVDAWTMYLDSNGSWYGQVYNGSGGYGPVYDGIGGGYSSYGTTDFWPPAGGVSEVPVPEPLSMIFFGTGLVAVGGFVARRSMLRKA